MRTIPVVRSTAHRAVVEQLRRMGVPAEVYLARAGIPPDALAEQDRLLPERSLRLLMDLVRDEEGIEDIGFQVGARHRVTDLVNLGPLVSGHPTLLKTMEAFCSRLHSHSNTWDYWVERHPMGVRLCRRGTPMDVGRWTFEQYAVAYLVDLVRMAAPQDWWPSEIWLEHRDPPSDREAGWMGDAHLHLDSRITAILVPETLLGIRPQVPGQEAVPFETEPIAKAVAPVFRELLRSTLVDGRPTLAEVSESLGLHPRTVQRRLAEENTSFYRLLNEVRLEIACSRLEEGPRPIGQISSELGYRDTAAFSKSFKRWAGVSPRTYRQANQTSG